MIQPEVMTNYSSAPVLTEAMKTTTLESQRALRRAGLKG